ncbi:MAG: acyl-CoA thioesterase [Candidatus Sumerlaeia bacterium]|nr:acyl-CoA thioesterase [Candidatus Sumerlaeia bacterium]
MSPSGPEPSRSHHPFEYRFRVGYADTDKMGFLHHARFIVYAESARTELLRKTGESYLEWEQRGVLLPLTACSLDFSKPAFYDDLVIVRVHLVEMTRLRLSFRYEFLRETDDTLLATGSTDHVFMSPELRPIRVSQQTLDRLAQFL